MMDDAIAAAARETDFDVEHSSENALDKWLSQRSLKREKSVGSANSGWDSMPECRSDDDLPGNLTSMPAMLEVPSGVVKEEVIAIHVCVCVCSRFHLQQAQGFGRE